MEPITTGLIFLFALLGKATIEKTGEKVVEVAWEKGNKLRKKLSQQSPTWQALEAAPEAPEEFEVKVLDAVFAEIKEDGELCRELEELAKQVAEAAQVNEELKVALEAMEKKIEASDHMSQTQNNYGDKSTNYQNQIKSKQSFVGGTHYHGH